MMRGRGVVCLGVCVLSACSAVKVQVNGEEMTLNEALGGVEGGGETHAVVLDASTSVSTSTLTMPMSTAIKAASELGYSCGDTRVMSPAIAKIAITHAQRVSVQVLANERAMGWVIIPAKGDHVCGADRKDGINQVFEAGTYSVHAAWATDSVDRLKAQAREPDRPVISLFLKTYGVNGASEEIVVDAKTQNPYYTNGASYRGGFVSPGELGFSRCEKFGKVSAQPVMELVVESKEPALELRDTARITWATLSEDRLVQCGDVTLKSPGRYKIYAMTREEQGDDVMYAPVLWDQTREVTLTGEVPSFSIDEFKKPIVIRGITRPNEMTLVKSCEAKDAHTGFEPDFFLEFDHPVPGVRVMLMPDVHGPQELVVEDITTRALTMSAQRTCARSVKAERLDRRRYSLERADGRYAGFLAHPGAPRDFVAIVWSDETEIDPWMTVGDLPEQTTTLDERVFPRYYPFFYDVKANELEAWKRVPESLRVYARKSSFAERATSVSVRDPHKGDDRLKVKYGEALLLVEVLDRRKTGEPGKVRVWTSDGFEMVIEGYTLTTEHPDTWQ